jgi:uncharacterized protein
MHDADDNKKLPHIVDALKLCQQKADLQGVVEFSKLPRLVNLLCEEEGNVWAEIVFEIDQQHRKVLSGNVKADLPLICQRCLGKMVSMVEASFDLALVWNDEQAAQLPRTLDPLLVDGTDIDLFSIVEDEILLSMPLIAHHEIGECVAPATNNPEIEVDDSEEKRNPFQVLASLKLAGSSRNDSDA